MLYLLSSHCNMQTVVLHTPLQVKETTMIIVEYPRRLASLVRDSVGPVVKVLMSTCRLL